MLRIGFIDLFIDEWHADRYPAWFRDAPRAKEFTLGHAWEEKPLEGRMPLEQWCARYGMTPAASIAEVVENSDAICVLAPANPEEHERLASLALESGKPLYIDKPFAPDLATARRIFDKARRHHTPLMSSSALRYGRELRDAARREFATERPTFIATTGGGRSFEEYGIHQLEMVVSQLGIGADAVRCTHCADGVQAYEIRYRDGRRHARLNYHPRFSMGFSLAGPAGGATSANGTDMFPALLADMMDFFATGVSPIPEAETLEIVALLEAAVKSRASRDWEAIP